MVILHIETTTNVCSVALSRDGKLLFDIDDSENSGMNHAEKLSLYIDDALKVLKQTGLLLDAVAVSGGPGSYTGLRIGVSTAKGLCYGYEIPLIAVDTLDILVEELLQKQDVENNSLICPMLDARRMEVYTKILDSEMKTLISTTPKIIDEQSFGEILSQRKVYFVGNGADKCKSVIISPNAAFVDDIEPLAKNMIQLAEQKYLQNDFEDLAYFEPFYLKEFQTTVSKKNIF